MRYEKAEILVRLALDLQGSLAGLSLEDIRSRYSPDAQAPLSRRTAERLRDAIERLFPQLEQSNPGELPNAGGFLPPPRMGSPPWLSRGIGGARHRRGGVATREPGGTGGEGREGHREIARRP